MNMRVSEVLPHLVRASPFLTFEPNPAGERVERSQQHALPPSRSPKFPGSESALSGSQQASESYGLASGKASTFVDPVYHRGRVVQGGTNVGIRTQRFC